MSNALKFAAALGGGPIYVDDVFSTYLYTGNGSTQTITNGIDLDGEGGLVWIKSRSAATDHQLFDTERAATNELISDSTAAQATDADTLTAFNADGFDIGADANVNTNSATYVSWTFRNAARFFDVQAATLSSSNATVNFTDLETLGMVIVKRTDDTGSWYVWHKDLTAGKLLYLEQTAAEATLGHITVSGTTLTLVDGTLADGDYVCYGFAHDTSDDGIIQCGAFTTDGSGNATVTLGWEPQWILTKRTDSNINGSWLILDSMRGFTVAGSNDGLLAADLSNAETQQGVANATATGFTTDTAAYSASATYIYLAIRRPNKPPTSGTEVYNAIARTGTGAAATVTGVGFAPDLVNIKNRDVTTTGYLWSDRLRGLQNIFSSSTAAEGASLKDVLSYDVDGIKLGSSGGAGDGSSNTNTVNYINHFFRRAPGFFDVVCYTGTGSAHTEAHNLGAVPELMIVKKRSGTDAWYVYHANNTANPETDYLVLNTTAGTADLDTIWNDTAPTSSVFTVGTNDDVNQSTGTFVAYLFATLVGISKVGAYTGNGTTQNIEMGFAAGARFFLVKATSTTGNWVVFDSERGIVAGSDPYLLLNSTAAEDTDEDAVDAYVGGITVNETSASSINTNAVEYIYLAIA